MKRVWLVERVNTSAGLEEDLDAQDAFLQKYCDEHNMLVVGVSRVHGNCALLRENLVTSTRNALFDVLLTASFSRFARTIDDFRELKAFTDPRGIELQTADHPIDMKKHEEALVLLYLLQATEFDMTDESPEDDESLEMTMN